MVPNIAGQVVSRQYRFVSVYFDLPRGADLHAC